MPDDTRILTVAQIVLNLNVGGLEKLVVSLINRLDRNRFRSVLYCLGESGTLLPEVRDRCAAVSVLNKGPGLAYGMPFRIARLMRRHRVDIAHCHNFSPLVYGSVAGRLAGLRGVVYTLHGPATSRLRKQLLFQRLKLVDSIVAVSNHARQTAIEEGGLDARSIVTITNGVDTAAYANGNADDRERLRAEIGIAPEEVLIGVVARLRPEKNHAMLLDAFAALKDDHPNARLAIVGDGELQDQLLEKTRVLGMEKRVLFLGNRNDVPRLLKSFDLFALPSQWEGLPLTVLEAMASGLAMVATNVGGIPEAVVHGETGLLSPPNDAERFAGMLGRVLDDLDAAGAMGRRGQEKARVEFDINDMIAKYELLYEKLAARRQ
jgi:sugar transferase (PEP-CTERM/EpsH1 system associated)